MRGTITKNGDKFYGVAYLGKDPKTGKKKYKWTKGAKGEREAQKLLNKMLSEIESGTFIEPSKATVGEFFEYWMEKYICPENLFI